MDTTENPATTGNRDAINPSFTGGLAPVWQLAFFSGILLLAFTARIYRLDHYSLWADEVWGVLDCELGSWRALVARLMYSDNHPPGYESFLYVWVKLFGDSDFSVRLPSVLTGVAAVFTIYQFGNRHFHRHAGLIAACLLAGSFQAIYYSQEARAYSPLLYFCCLNAYAFLNIFIDNSSKQSDWWSFWISGTFMVYLHYTGSVFLASEALVLLFIYIKTPDRQKLIDGIKAFTPVLVLYSPWLPTMYSHANDLDYWAAKPTLESFFLLWRFLLGPGDGLLVIQAACLVSVTALIAHDVVFKRPTGRESQKAAILLALLLVPMLIFFAKSYYTQSIHENRHFIYGIPLICLLVAYYISRMANHLDNKESLATLIVVITFVIAFEEIRSNQENHLYSLNDKQEIREGAAVVIQDKAFINSKDIIISSHDFFLHYLRKKNIRNSYQCCFNDVTPLQDIVDVINNKKAQTFYFLEVILPGQPMLGMLQSQYRETCSSDLNMVRVSKFRTDKPPAPGVPVPTCPQ